jgi:hypothetical protein
MPASATATERRGKNAVVAGFLSRSACAEFQKEGIACQIGAVKEVGGATQLDIVLGTAAVGVMRLLINYPFVTVLAATGEISASDKQTILGSIKLPSP